MDKVIQSEYIRLWRRVFGYYAYSNSTKVSVKSIAHELSDDKTSVKFQLKVDKEVPSDIEKLVKQMQSQCPNTGIKCHGIFDPGNSTMEFIAYTEENDIEWVRLQFIVGLALVNKAQQEVIGRIKHVATITAMMQEKGYTKEMFVKKEKVS